MSDDKALIEAAVKQINEDSKYSTQRDYDNLMDSVERVLFTETPFNIADAATTVLAILADRLKDQKSSAAS